ncbi:MAG: Ig-like domain-containing protein [Armatimonadetes bacterium]|nr:Ig-like domain-containing protein [Armatimonadota bacterium]
MADRRLMSERANNASVWLVVAAALLVSTPVWSAGGSDTYSLAVTADSPASYWRLNDSSGTTAVDQQGAANGTATVTWGEGGALANNIATAALFSPASNSTVDVNQVLGLIPGSGALTVEAWAKVKTPLTAMAIVNWDPSGYSTTVSQGSYQLRVSAAGKAEFAVSDSASTALTVAGPSIDDNKWHHLVGVVDRTNALLRLYVDGEQAATTAASTLVALLDSSPTSQPLSIGSRFVTPGPPSVFDGWIDEVAVYLGALSADRVAAHYAIGANALVVSTTNDNGEGSLRKALRIANTHVGLDVITFGLTGSSAYEIVLSTALPSITDKVTIDGTSQSGYTTKPVVGIIGPPSTAPGLVFDGGSGSTVKGLAFDGFTAPAIQLNSTSDTTTIQACWIGLRPAGTPTGITGSGIVIAGSDDNLIGGGSPSTANVIVNCSSAGVQCSGTTALGSTIGGNLIGLAADGVTAKPNGTGVLISGGNIVVMDNVISGNSSTAIHLTGTGATGNIVEGNTVGLNQAGSAAAANGGHGVYLDAGATNNTIGGTTTAKRNVISGNSGDGVRIWGGCSANTVEGNYIGLDATGAAALGNDDGVQIAQGAHDNLVGGTTTSARNVIAGSRLNGVSLADTGTLGNKVMGNTIGLDAAGTGALAVTGHGVLIHAGATDNTIGGTAAGAGNIIANSSGCGVAVLGSTSTGNAIEGNSIHDNASLGIDLVSDGVTANDASDPDTGPNQLQNTPVLDGAVTSGAGSLTVVGSLDSTTADSSYPVRLEFFRTGTADGSGHGEGLEYLGTKSVAAPGAFSASLAVTVAAGTTLSATATDAGGNTSEFATNVTCAGPASRLAFATDFSDAVAGVAINPRVVVEVRDSGNRRVYTSTATVTVAVSTPPSGATLLGTTSVAAVQGQAVFADINMTQPGSGLVVTAAANGLASAISAAFAITPASVDAAHTLLAVDKTTATADGTDTVALTITARDQYDNLVPGLAPSNLVVSGTPNAGLTIDQPTGSTDVNGRTTASARCTALAAVTFSVAVGATASPNTTQTIFQAGPPVAANCAITANPTTAAADGADTVTLTLTVHDANGHPVSGVAASRLRIAANPAAGVTLTQPAAATDAAGQTTASATSTRARTVAFSAKLDNTAFPATADVAFQPGPVDAATSTLVTDRSAILADGTDTATLTVTALDAQGNPLAGVTAANLVFSVSPSAGMTLTQPTAPTDSLGRASATLLGTVAGIVTVSVRVNGTLVTATADVTLSQPPVDAATSTLAVDRTAIRADGTDVANLTVTARDAQGRPLAGIAAANVVFSVSPTPGLTLTQPTTATDGQGRATATLAGTWVGTATVSVRANGTLLTATVQVALTATTVDGANSGLSANVSAVTADGTAPVTLTVALRDTSGNPITGIAASRLTVRGAPTTGLVITQPATVTDAAGHTTATAACTKAGTVTFTALLDGGPLGVTAQVTFTPGQPHAPSCTLTADKTSATADGADTVSFTITLRDASGNPVPGVAPSLLRVGPAGATGLTVVQPSAPTNALGQTTASATCTLAQGVTFDLAVATVPTGSTQLVNFVAGGPDPARCTLVANRGQATADGADSVVLTATVSDAQGNPLMALAGTRLGLRVTGLAVSGGSFGMTSASGQAAAVVTSTRAGTAQFQLTVDGAAAGVPQQVVFVPGPADQARSSLVSDKSSARADGTDALTLTLTLRDAHDNPLPGVAASSLSTSVAGALANWVAFAPVGQATDSAGRMLLRATATRPQSAALHVALGALGWSQPALFTPLRVDSGRSNVSVAPAVIAADDAERATVTVHLADARGVPVEGSAVGARTISLDNQAATVIDGGQTTALDGAFSFDVKSSAPGRVTVSTVVDGVRLPDAVITARAFADIDLPAGLSFMGLPLTPDTDSLSNWLGVAGLHVARWDVAAQAYAAQGSAYQPGTGLWVSTDAAQRRRLLGVPTPPSVQRIPLTRGWNACANPFGAPLNWDLAAIGVEVNGALVGQLGDQSLWTSTVLPYGWAYRAGLGYRLVFDPTRLGFEAALGVLPSGAGVWVQALRDNVALVLPPTPPGTGRARRAVSARDWALALAATQGDGVRQSAVVGVSSDLSRPLDLSQPPAARGEEPALLSVLSTQGGRLAGALALPAETQVWELELRSATRAAVVLDWPALGRALPRGLVLELVDPTSGGTTLLNTRSAWRWQPTRAGETRRLRLTARLGHVARSAITGLTLGGNRGGSQTISLTLSAPADVTLTVRGLGGRVVKSLRWTCAAGTTGVAWDGTDADGRPVPRGVYQLEAQATSPNGAVDKATRTVTVP